MLFSSYLILFLTTHLVGRTITSLIFVIYYDIFFSIVEILYKGQGRTPNFEIIELQKQCSIALVWGSFFEMKRMGYYEYSVSETPNELSSR